MITLYYHILEKGDIEAIMKGFSTEQIAEAIAGTNGNISLIAVKLKCSWATARKYISGSDELRQEFKGETERMLDKAESIVNNALDDDTDKKTQLETAKWILATKGHSRGYNTKNKHYESRNALAPYNQILFDPDE